MNSYKQHLFGLEGNNIVIHRANAADIEGKLAEVCEDGCRIQQSYNNDWVKMVFIAYTDIRGVVRWEPNTDNI